ncbi:MAG: hypothetical protein KKA62_01755, partial [Nanoarchaeota archaeon]|nr:hypothetical protein [Nanoarchaeota archaeon]
MNRRSLMLVGVFVLLLFLVSCLPQKPLTDEELEAELTKLTPEEREVLVKDLESGDGALAGQASARTIPSRVKNVPKIRIIDAINNLPVPVPEP